MDAREKLTQEILNLGGSNWVLELATGTGKTKIAIEKTKQLKAKKVLIVVPRLVLKQEWRKELKKWWGEDLDSVDFTITTYMSFPSNLDKKTLEYDVAIFDEGHHISQRCLDCMGEYHFKHAIILSATISKRRKQLLREAFGNLEFFTMDLRDVIAADILPDPLVYLIPLRLDNTKATEVAVRNPKGTKTVRCRWDQRFAFFKGLPKTTRLEIECTQMQYMQYYDNLIEFYKNQVLMKGSRALELAWLKQCGDRLKYLSNIKTSYVRSLLNSLEKKRTITFCNGITQTEELGSYCINSRNKESSKILEDFNNGAVNHITACNMVNEGCNLSDCQVGIYANLNSSETIVKQRLGRLLRHPNPIVVIPYYENTREEEIVRKMVEDYNPELIKIIYNLNSLKV